MLPVTECPCYILAGGKGLRFGADKGRVYIGTVPNILRVEAQMKSRGHLVQIVADHSDRYADIGIECLVDASPEGGPIVGLLTALRHRLQSKGPGWILVLTCDQVVWLEEWYSDLAVGLNDQSWASVFCEETIQPLPGMFHTNFLPQIESALQSGQSSIRRLLVGQSHHVDVHRTQINPRSGSFNDALQLAEIIKSLDKQSLT